MTEDWVIKRGHLYLVAPHWILWDTLPSAECRFTHEAAMRWIESYENFGNGYAVDGPPEAVAVYEPLPPNSVSEEPK
jgi:hypothetical protein